MHSWNQLRRNHGINTNALDEIQSFPNNFKVLKIRQPIQWLIIRWMAVMKSGVLIRKLNAPPRNLRCYRGIWNTSNEFKLLITKFQALSGILRCYQKAQGANKKILSAIKKFKVHVIMFKGHIWLETLSNQTKATIFLFQLNQRQHLATESHERWTEP